MSIIKSLSSIYSNLGRVKCISPIALHIGITTVRREQYLYSYGYTEWDQYQYQTLVKNPISLVSANGKTIYYKDMCVFHPDKIMYPIIDIKPNQDYIIRNDDLVYYNILRFGFSTKLVIVPHS
jgi:hypothetical protein